MQGEYYFVKTNRWESPVKIQSQTELAEGDVVIIETNDGVSSAIVQTQSSESPKAENPGAAGRFLRRANPSDLKVIGDQQKKGKEALEISRQEVKKTGLPMKIVDAIFSFDGGNITFAFIADGRVDFRDLVKNLSKRFQRSIRLHQVGARDESRQGGGYGICGRELCCVKFRGDLPSITSEMAKVQQIAHRGSERISGICGRLMCCLAYESEQYRELLKNFPAPGSEVKYKGEKAVVKDVNVMSGEIKLELPDKTMIFINKSEL
jgi:cell fate regulator YaaT (PSP1 superfamily)